MLKGAAGAWQRKAHHHVRAHIHIVNLSVFIYSQENRICF